MNTCLYSLRRGLFVCAFASALGMALAQEETSSSSAAVSSSSRIVEEKTTVETRRVYQQVDTARKAPRKVAIFIDNRAGPQYNDKVLFLEDQISSQAGGKDFAIVSREDVLKAVKIYRGANVVVASRNGNLAANGSVQGQLAGNGNVTAGRVSGQLDGQVSQTEEASVAASDATRNTLGTESDQLLSNSSSALRLAQNMGADFLLQVTLGSYGKETRSFNDPNLGVSAKSTVYTLRGTYKVLEGVNGSTLGGGPYRQSKTVRQSDNLQVDDQDVLNDLLEQAAVAVADSLRAKAASFVPAAQVAKVEISISCGVKDVEGNEVSLQDIRITENNTLVKDEQLVPAQASATIEVDGFALGTTPARLKVAPGAHKLRLSRAGFDTLELTLNATQGLELNPTMQMSAEGFARWKAIRDFLNKLDTQRKLTDAEAEKIRGEAQMLRQSGIRFDVRVNSTNAPAFVKNNSIFGQSNY